MNGIKYKRRKKRNREDLIKDIKRIKRYVRKRNVKRFIIVIENE